MDSNESNLPLGRVDDLRAADAAKPNLERMRNGLRVKSGKLIDPALRPRHRIRRLGRHPLRSLRQHPESRTASLEALGVAKPSVVLALATAQASVSERA